MDTKASGASDRDALGALVRLVEEHDLLTKASENLQELREHDAPYLGSPESGIYPRSLRWHRNVLCLMARHGGQRLFIQIAPVPFESIFPASTGDEKGRLRPQKFSGLYALAVRPTAELLPALWRAFPFTKPVSLRDRRTTIGMGDRLGIATPGHIRSIRGYNVFPVLAQQSVREMNFTDRTFPQVIADASFAVFQESYESGFGADGDHLKSMDRIAAAVHAGAPMITLDLTDVLRPQVADWSAAEVATEYRSLSGSVRARLERDYVNVDFDCDGNKVTLDDETLQRCSLLYGEAISFAVEVNEQLSSWVSEGFDLEISIDETTTPTLPEHHLFVARELKTHGVAVNSIAPRFVGEFQKGIDYIGDVEEFDAQLSIHCGIARTFGDYKISVHSGSDKLSVFPSIGRRTNGRFHLKTAGTSWLEAIRVVARTEPTLYRRVHEKALEYYPEALKSYHITPDLAAVPSIEDVTDDALPQLLDHAAWRQVLHVSYGGLLADNETGPELRRCLFEHEDEYFRGLEAHFERHFDALGLKRADLEEEER